jgi:hypothetical protein
MKLIVHIFDKFYKLKEVFGERAFVVTFWSINFTDLIELYVINVNILMLF